MKNFHRILPVAVVFVLACHSEDYKPLDYGQDFAPLRKGLYHIYDVDETIYNEANPPQHNVYQLKIVLSDSFPDVEGSFTYVMTRLKRATQNSSWMPFGRWSVRNTGKELVVNEGNISFTRLAFPVKRDARWNGNRFNTLSEDDFRIDVVDQPAVIGVNDFEKTLTVVEEDNEDYVFFLDERKSVFARNVGLVARYVTQLSYCTDDNCRGQQKIKSGIIYKQEIAEYGFE